jgi:hypothetical protein
LILTPNIVALAIIESVVLIFSILVLFYSLRIVLRWDFSSTTNAQYRLEKSSFLVSLVIFFIAIIKIAIMPFFIFIIDSLSVVLHGAMCGTGVINANEYGVNLLLFKLSTLFIAGLWIVVHKLDINSKDYPYMRYKSYLFLLLFVMIVVEDWLYFKYFSNIEFDIIVECCSAVFSTAQSALELPLGMSLSHLLVLFGLLSGLLYISAISNYHYVSLFTNILYIIISIYVVIYFFSTYVYEIPTHQCPFCLFQKEYYYIGYIIFGSLFSSTYISIYYNMMFIFLGRDYKILKKYSIILLAIFILSNIYFPISYYIKNGVWM